MGKGGEYLIAPEAEHWDFVMLVRQSSIESFLAFSNHVSYLEGTGHLLSRDKNMVPLKSLF